MVSTAMQSPPYKGQNDQYPIAQIANPFCERMRNFHNRGGLAELRDGNELLATITASGLPDPKSIEAYRDKLIVAVDTTSGFRWYEVQSGTPTLVHSLGGLGAPLNDVATLRFRNNLYYFGNFGLALPAGGPQVYDGATWALAGYTWPAGFTPFGGVPHKNRGYVIGRDSSSYAFTEVDSTSGATKLVDLSGVISEPAFLSTIRPISISSKEAEAVLAFLFESGEILAYRGPYPLATSWGLSSRFKVTPLLFNNAAIDAKGDSFILTRAEILSLRNLYTGGYDREREEGIGAAISNRWKQIVRAIEATSSFYFRHIRGAYDAQRDRLVISLPWYVDPDGSVDRESVFQLLYDFTLGGWYEYIASKGASDDFPAVGISYWQNQIAYLLSTGAPDFYPHVFTLDTGVGAGDDTINGGGAVGKRFQLRSAPFSFPKFGTTQCQGIEAIVQSNMYENVELRLVGNLGAQESGAQTTEGNGTAISSVLFPVGVEGNFVQYDISGTSTPGGTLKLFAFNPWVSSGEEGAR